MPKHDMGYATGTVDYPASLSAESTANGMIRGYGTTVGNGVEGWAPGAVFTNVDGTTYGTLLYVNIGTKTTANWVQVSDPRLAYDSQGVVSSYCEDFCPRHVAYTELAEGTGSVTDSVFKWGSILVASDATDNNATSYNTDAPVIDVDGADTSWKWEARIRLTEANTDDANWWCGLIEIDDIDADVLADNGAGPKSNYEGAIFWKVNDGTTVEWEVSKATTQESQSMGDWTHNTWITLGMVYDSTPTVPTMTPYLNGTAGTSVSWANVATQAWVCAFGVKAGDTNAETLQVDYHKAVFWAPSGSR